ncbi:glycine dehydrogenase (decarboxylating) beta subunit [Herbinix hemicellulosilytica]|uniref:Probable glycine dehydrogenase (decarboxylating) subunit 2 n=1 Tax=Herbinix hemicellulosilytica TaxID=1564487 RepID=A0A0H5STJ8_HERHM|nr:aminomethyl-transferring glycine dehydrogenase subunit GcvPB [Herbinix hemicellulosilytica]RBP60245.1 glycine dehydrogenase (decarboxylating) beta subunit [Herbinix hemicellulosilytica]CRZ33613.1 putative glycine dehydrogenase [decarboxylating] subunit 2 [Herbinix hemicellulosilytica]
MKLIFEKGNINRGLNLLPECDVPLVSLKEEYERKKELNLPQVSETEISRHYTELAKRTYGVNNGFYPLGSCTMKYNPKINDEMAKLPEFTEIHPLQPLDTVQGCLEVYKLAEKYLCEITGMDRIDFQPAAGAHGEFTGLKLIWAYHKDRNDTGRTKIIVPDSAHGTNPASAAMAGFTVVNVPSTPEGMVDIEVLKTVVGDDTAGFMLTNPNTVGIFEEHILEITNIIHEAGGLCYYDGANLNAIMGITRPGDMGFDVVHLNLHKTFSTPHGGGGPGSGPVGCKEFLAKYLPSPKIFEKDGLLVFDKKDEKSIGRVKEFYGNFLVVVRALTYMMTLGAEGLKEASENAVLNANYMMHKLKDIFSIPFGKGRCMHEFVISLADLKKDTSVSALDFAKTLLDYGIHPPTMYFPLIVQEALMVEPTETETRETLDEVIEIFREIYTRAHQNPDELHNSPIKTPIGRPDEVAAARNPLVRHTFS